jgi:predicted GH43/DUF377 family glycosyl hydrolase
LYKISSSGLKLIANWPLGYGTPDNAYSLRIVKKGTTYSVAVEGRMFTTFTNPGWDKDASPHPDEPDGGYWGFAFEREGVHTVSGMHSFSIPSLEFFPENPVVQEGPKGAWDQIDVFPGAVLAEGKHFYMYYDGDYEYFPPGIDTEILHRIGIATSSDLEHWTKFEKNPVFGPPLEGDTVSFFGLPPSYKSATQQAGGGIVLLPNGHYGLTINVQANVQWLGVWLAEAPFPLGPFQGVRPGHILTLGGPGSFDEEHIHLHGAQRLADGTYAMLYTGFSSKIKSGRPGDRGGLATSKDMIHWTKYSGNPVFAPGVQGSWDDLHVRPKTFARLGKWYYMFYEGAHYNSGGWPDWPDQVGMARSQDLIHWERYPYNPIVPTTTSKQFGDVAQIQPATVASDGELYIFYGCLRAEHSFAVCGAKVPPQLLEKWGGQ